eukprot:scaffold7625_cov97-Isochrysis_galbana.AAC.1
MAGGGVSHLEEWPHCDPQCATVHGHLHQNSADEEDARDEKGKGEERRVGKLGPAEGAVDEPHVQEERRDFAEIQDGEGVVERQGALVEVEHGEEAGVVEELGEKLGPVHAPVHQIVHQVPQQESDEDGAHRLEPAQPHVRVRAKAEWALGVGGRVDNLGEEKKGRRYGHNVMHARYERAARPDLRLVREARGEDAQSEEDGGVREQKGGQGDSDTGANLQFPPEQFRLL